MNKHEKNILKFTGERLIPKINVGRAFYYEHLARYFFASQFSKSKTVLDVACGTGYGCKIISVTGKATKVVGIDVSAESIKFSQKYYRKDNIDYLVDDAQTLSSQSNDSFDLIVSFETIEHLNYPEKFIKQTKRLLKNDGILIISTPNTNTYPKGNKYHINEQTPDEFRLLLKKYYKYVENYYQKFYLSNLISQKDNTIFNSVDNQLELNDINSEYLICICSDRKIPDKYGIIKNINKIDQLDVTKGYISLSNQFSDLYKENSKFNQIILEINQKSEEKNKELENIKQSKFFKFWQKYNKIKTFFIKK